MPEGGSSCPGVQYIASTRLFLVRGIQWQQRNDSITWLFDWGWLFEEQLMMCSSTCTVFASWFFCPESWNALWTQWLMAYFSFLYSRMFDERIFTGKTVINLVFVLIPFSHAYELWFGLINKTQLICLFMTSHANISNYTRKCDLLLERRIFSSEKWWQQDGGRNVYLSEGLTYHF